MNDVETRSLRRAALLLLVVSGVRWGWQARPRPAPPPAPEAGVALLEGSRTRAADAERRARPLAPGERIDPNRAPAEELDRLPGIGPATARAVVAFRDSAGAFRRAGDLAGVPGIGAATVARVTPLLDLADPPPARTIRPGRSRPPGVAPPLSLNAADEEALQMLPGVGPALARRIVEARRTRPFRTVEDLLLVRGIGPATLERIRRRVTVRP